jgi:protein involved in polysaccharide export with SLBB domain
VRLNSQILVNPQQLAVLVRTFEPGDELKLTVVREGKETMLTVKLEQREVKPLEHVVFGSQFMAEGAIAWEAKPAAPVRPGDQVLVTMRDVGGEGLQTMELVKVSAKGELRPPLLKKSIRAGGLSPAQLQKAIADAYRAENVLDPAKVTIGVIPVPSTHDPFAVQK